MAQTYRPEDRFELTPAGEAYLNSLQAPTCSLCGDPDTRCRDGICQRCNHVLLRYERRVDDDAAATVA